MVKRQREVLEINLKDQEIPGLDENSKIPELGVIDVPSHGRPVDPILAATGARNSPREVELRAVPKLVD